MKASMSTRSIGAKNWTWFILKNIIVVFNNNMKYNYVHIVKTPKVLSFKGRL